MSAEEIHDSVNNPPRPASTISAKSESLLYSENQSETHLHSAFVTKNVLTFATLLGIFLGVTLGFTFKHSPLFGEGYWTPRRLSYVKLPGDLFLDMLRCMSLPILISSLMAAVGSLDTKSLNFTIWKIFAYIFVSTVAATALGALLVITIKPGDPKDYPLHPACFEVIQVNASYRELRCSKEGHPCIRYKDDIQIWSIQDELKNTAKPPSGPDLHYCTDSLVDKACELAADRYMDYIRHFFPSNIIRASLITFRTRPNLKFPEDPKADVFSSLTWLTSCRDYFNSKSKSKPSLEDYHLESFSEPDFNVHGILLFFMFVALAGMACPESGRPALNFMTSLSECTLMMGTWIIWLSPVSVGSIVAGHILEQTSFFLFPPTIFYYLATCVLGLLLYSLVVLPLVYYLLVQKSPFKFYKRLVPVMVVKLGTTSGTGSLPVTMEFLETACGLDPRVVRLMNPISSQVNSDGTALVTAVAVGYIAQLHGVELGFTEFFNIITFTFMAVSSTPTSNASVTERNYRRRILVALKGVGLPFRFATYVAAIDWVIDGLAAVTNALSDCVGCAIIHHLSLSHFESQHDLSSMSSGKKQANAKSYYRNEVQTPTPTPTPPVPGTTNADSAHAPGQIKRKRSTIPKNSSPSNRRQSLMRARRKSSKRTPKGALLLTLKAKRNSSQGGGKRRSRTRTRTKSNLDVEEEKQEGGERNGRKTAASFGAVLSKKLKKLRKRSSQKSKRKVSAASISATRKRSDSVKSAGGSSEKALRKGSAVRRKSLIRKKSKSGE